MLLLCLLPAFFLQSLLLLTYSLFYRNRKLRVNKTIYRISLFPDYRCLNKTKIRLGLGCGAKKYDE